MVATGCHGIAIMPDDKCGVKIGIPAKRQRKISRKGAKLETKFGWGEAPGQRNVSAEAENKDLSVMCNE
jgi:hypothetical protein